MRWRDTESESGGNDDQSGYLAGPLPFFGPKDVDPHDLSSQTPLPPTSPREQLWYRRILPWKNRKNFYLVNKREKLFMENITYEKQPVYPLRGGVGNGGGRRRPGRSRGREQ